MDRNFGGIIWTDHALERLKERGIKQGDAWATWRRPDQSREGHQKGNWIYYRTWGNERIEVVTAKNEKVETVVLSVWSRPVYETKRVYKSLPIWDRFLEKILQKLLGWMKRY